MKFAGWAARQGAAVGARAWMACAAMGLLLSQVGVSHAQVSVGDSGTPSYGQGIAVPPGIAGMAPKLSLFYGGGGVNGPLGHGWSVQGLSAITRCPATVAVDNRRAGVLYGPNDKLCLDGQRLIQTDATGAQLAFPQANDAAGLAAGATREYRTEKEIYARIRAYGYANGDTSGASGPAYFRVWTKAGQIYDYGASLTSDANTKALIATPGKPPMAWAVARIGDTQGNFIDFKYEQRDVAWGSGPTTGSTVGHEWNILEIQYGGNKVLFNYDLVDGNLNNTDPNNDRRPDKAEAYQLGNKNVSLRRLKSITTYVNSPASAMGVNGGTAVKTTKLSYEIGTVSGRSRINKIQECAGGPTSARCLPASTLQYANGGNEAYQASSGFASSPLASLDMLGTNGTTGVLLGDFNGDGKTDVIYWSDSPANNKLYTSNGDGGFTRAGTFNITDANLFKSDGCYYAIAADFNSDGITDILRVMRPTSTNGTNASCGAVANMLLTGAGNGSFNRVLLAAEITFTQTTSTMSVDSRRGSRQTAGANYYLVDINGDGYLDIVTTILPGYDWSGTGKTDAQQCAAIVCTRIYLLDQSLNYVEFSQTNLTNRSVYADPKRPHAYFKSPYVGDVDGDGHSDLNVGTGLWISQGNGNFVKTTTSSFTSGCANQIDANGDGRIDCINVSAAASSQSISIGAGAISGALSGTFNLTGAGQELYDSIYHVSSNTNQQTAGMLAIDLNGDGRQDILRWKDDPSQNAVYLSKGDGSFIQSSNFNLGGVQLQKSDGTRGLQLGDFTGRGAAELLRLQTDNGTVSNVLYTKIDSSPADQLVSVTSGSGLKTTLYYVPLSNSTPSNGVSANLGERYISDRGSNAVADAVDVTMPMYVVATSVSDSGVGTSKLATEMRYRGLKADLKGRGLLGFREVLRQRPGAEGSPLTVATQYLQIPPYAGVAASTSTYRSALDAINASVLLSTTTNTYCDQSNTAAVSTTANCPVSATTKITKPYLYWSNETGKDLSGTTLPTVTTTHIFNGNGDPTEIKVTTTGTGAGIAQEFIKTTSNEYLTANTACSDEKTCVWILGRLEKASVTSTVPNSLDAIARSPGNSPMASATAGNGAPPPATPQPPTTLSPAVLSAILSILLED